MNKSNSFCLIKEFKIYQANVFFIGIVHTKEFSDIENVWNEVLRINPDIILLEGNFDKPVFQSKEEAIKLGGEMGFFSYFGRNLNIPLVSNDPLENEEISFLEKKYSREFCFLYFLLRDMAYFNLNFEDSGIDLSVNHFKNNSNWSNFNYSTSHLISIFDNILGNEFNKNEINLDWFNPQLNLNLMNSCTRMLNQFRDDFMINLVKKLSLEHRKILILKGQEHLVENEAKFLVLQDETSV